MPEPNFNETPYLNDMAKKLGNSVLWGKLYQSRIPLSEENKQALEYRQSKGYKPTNVPSVFIDVKNKDQYNEFEKLLKRIPNNAKRNKFIAELGYRPVLRYSDTTTVANPQQVIKTPSQDTTYQVGFTTMPGRTININKQQYNDAQKIKSIDDFIAQKYQEKFKPTGLNREDSYQSYVNANPADYNKMFLDRNARNNIISEYAKANNVNPQELISFYESNRDLYYPRELVAGAGSSENTSGAAANTVWGYKNQLTSLIPKQIISQTEIQTQTPESKQVITQMTNPFKFGYASSGGDSGGFDFFKKGKPEGPNVCSGEGCEKQEKIMAKKNRFLKRHDGGKLTKNQINTFKEKFGLLKK